ncbi:hypothetical protein [Sphingomonas albertensis]|uniref:Uncharacterized protein n=1 Tax=Sphingomonas albertensis TaxID=2762591 RepID=A0ABR7AJI9_9SPHN|nr:hypothetical protein [Sphingomonas albertensis]MBC3940610.1 hypothetical protein [Sphingomonas albertensis]
MDDELKNLDLSEIDPLKWAEFRRRVFVLEQYLALPNPTSADRIRHGAKLNLGAQQFQNLVRTWETDHDPRKLSPGVRKRAVRHSRSRRGGVDPAAREIARGVIAELGSSASLRELVELVRLRCTALRITPPSRGTIWLLSVEARGSPSEQHGNAILVARAFLKLPVETAMGTVFPELTVAVNVSTRRILAIETADPEATPDLRDLATAIRGRDPVILADLGIRTRLSRYVLGRTPMATISEKDGRRTLAQVLGRKIGLLEVAYRNLNGNPAKSMHSFRDRALNFDDARTAVAFAMERHNAAVAAAAEADLFSRVPSVPEA